MPSIAGRGAQVRLDGNTQKAARGTLSATIEGNRDGKRALELAGTAADGTTADGSTLTGTAAADETLTGGATGAVLSVAGRTGAVVIAPADVSDAANASTGYIQDPVGTTAQRPAGQVAGRRRFNISTSRSEFDTGTAWMNHARLSGDTFTGGICQTVTALTDAATINGGQGLTMTNGNAFTLLCTSLGSRLLSVPSAIPAGAYYSWSVRVTQDATGGRLVTVPAAVTKTTGTQTTTANARNVYSFVTFDGGISVDLVIS